MLVFVTVIIAPFLRKFAFRDKRKEEMELAKSSEEILIDKIDIKGEE